MNIETYAQLQNAVADWLNRSDLGDVIPFFIHNAESEFKRDARVRRRRQTSLTADAATKALPADFAAMDTLTHDGADADGELENAGTAGALTRIAARNGGNAAAPTHYVVQDGALRFGPEPDQAYPLELAYWDGFTRLSDTMQTNWLLDEHPDVYLYGSLVESAPYLRDDSRVALWEKELEKRLQEMEAADHREEFSGRLTQSFARAIP